MAVINFPSTANTGDTYTAGVKVWRYNGYAWDLINQAPYGSFDGNNGPRGNTNFGDIFRMHSNTLSQNVTFYSGNNAVCAGPLNLGSTVTITIQTGARVVIV